MATIPIVEEYVAALVTGNRITSREFVQQQISQIEDVTKLYKDILWPAMERVEKLFRGDRINRAAQQMAIRIHRAIADQVQSRLPRLPTNGKRIVITCAEGEPEELGAQMSADLFESCGWDVYFVGSGVPNDEILNLVGQLSPDILLIFGTQPSGVPGTRRLIDLIREIGVNPTMNVMVSGGVFNRADGLWKEVNADLIAKTVHEAIPMAESIGPRAPEAKVMGAPKKRRRRRRPVGVGEAATV